SVGSSDGTGGADVSSSEDAESQAASSSQEPSSEKGQPEASSTPPSIDIANVDTLHAVNIFLSNFSEKGSLMNGYTYEGASNQLVGDFSASHTHINNPYNISYGPAYPTVISYETPDEIFLRYPRVFLKRDLPREEDGMRFEGTDYGSFEGHVDLHSNRVPTEPLGIAYATSSEDAGEGRSRITFDVYYGGTSYDVEDMSYYNCTLEELKSRLGVSQPIATGVAVVEPYEDGTIAPFLLWSYESTR
ncbi:MAG: hypothetical protein IJ131_00265, partial [Eggerthellaceae bacterium]|nr:hypothetical protein [Eggerthellaceae bacterium]